MDDVKKTMVAFYRKHLRLPSLRELTTIADLPSVKTASWVMREFEIRGFLEKDGVKFEPNRDTFLTTIKILGQVSAGFPSASEEIELERISLDEYLIEKPESSFLLQVSGDSMKDAGIMAGDWVLVERGAEARVGNIVIACVDGEWTMKYYAIENGKPCLRPANDAYKTIYPKDTLEIEAVVRALIRKYR